MEWSPSARQSHTHTLFVIESLGVATLLKSAYHSELGTGI